MTATSHAVLGTIIAAKFSNPFLAVPIALASHVVADIYPHWDSGTNGRTKTKWRLRIEATIDVILGFIISYFVLAYFFPQTDLTYAFFMILVAQAFDWISAPYYFFNIKFLPFKKFYQFQHDINTRLQAPWGVLSQIAALIIVIALAKLY